MSPEQATGRAADTRSDLWAFGVVLLEMLTGRPVFTGETDADVLESVLHADPDCDRAACRDARTDSQAPPPLSREGPHTTARFGRCGSIRDRRCDCIAGRRDRSISEQRRVASHRSAIAALASGALLIALAVWAVMLSRPRGPVPPSRFAIVTPPGQPLNVDSNDRDLALSPDGRHLVYRFGGTGNERRLFDGACDRSARRAPARGYYQRVLAVLFP